jgi:glycine/D-amino acid oxidase-like deaminating enzyme
LRGRPIEPNAGDTLERELAQLGHAGYGLVRYNAGVDPAGNGVSQHDLVTREEIVFEWIDSQESPAAFVLAGGYVGDGVGTANLGGRTLADLILGRDSELTRLPWVNHQSPKWEPEPLRWAGVRTGNFVMASADRVENRKGKDSIRARAFQSLIGG